jgi:xylan 1,4-beta-xylosidase
MFADPEQRNAIRRGRPFTRYVNCVRLIGGRTDGRNQYFKGVAPDGSVRSDFTGLIAQLRGMLDTGYTPRIVLDNVPTAMSDPPEMHTYGNTYPPKDFGVWHQYVEALACAIVDEFGLEVVSTWRFRVGTEPDLYPGHWAGTKEQYLQHYDYTVDAVTGVIPDADIGPGNILNPAAEGHTAAGRPRWGLDIVDHAATGTNRCTGEPGTRLRHLSCSWYGRVGRSIDSFDVAIRRMRDRLDRHPRFRDVPVEVAEFAVLQDEYGRRLMGGDVTEWGASWYAAIADRVYALDVAQVHEWAQASAGIWHPRTHVLWMLEQMTGGQRLATQVKGTSAARCGAIASRKGVAIYLLLYNHRALRTPKVTEHITLTLRDPRMKADAQWTLSEWRIDESHAVFIRDFYENCEAAGIEPLPNAPIFGGNLGLRFGPEGGSLLRENIERYQKLAALPQTRTDEPLTVGEGQVSFELDLPGHSVRLLKLSPR